LGGLIGVAAKVRENAGATESVGWFEGGVVEVVEGDGESVVLVEGMVETQSEFVHCFLSDLAEEVVVRWNRSGSGGESGRRLIAE
jgi:hypothetical protein